MTGIIEWLQGKKAYIIMILGFVFNVGVLAGFWPVDSQMWALINSILGFLGLGTLRSAAKKLEQKK